MDMSGYSWSPRCGIFPKNALGVVNYFRWVWVRISNCVNGSWSQNIVFKLSSLIQLVTYIMADVVIKVGPPGESYVNQDNQQGYWSLVESLIIKELWSRQVEGLGCFRKVLLSTIVINHQTKATMVFFELLEAFKGVSCSKSPAESPLCWGSHVLASLAIPKDETTSEPLLDLRI